MNLPDVGKNGGVPVEERENFSVDRLTGNGNVYGLQARKTLVAVEPLTSKTVVQRALDGLAISRPATGPLAVHYCARLSEVSLRDYTLDPVVMSDCVLRYYERFQPDAVWLSADTWVSAQAMGAVVGFPDDNQPMCGRGRPVICSPADVDRIPKPDPSSQGRMPLMQQALARVVERVGDDAFVVACFDQYPFSLACALMGVDQVMLKLFDDRPLVEAVMERCLEYGTAYAQCLARCGPHMLSGGDSPAGLLGPDRYRAVVLPYEKRLIANLRSTGGIPVSLHICGDSTPILPKMAATGAQVLELDYQVDAATACRIVGPNIAIWGNIDPVGVLARGTPEHVTQCVRNLRRAMHECGHRRFVLSSGCTLAMETPEENLHAMIQGAREASVPA